MSLFLGWLDSSRLGWLAAWLVIGPLLADCWPMRYKQPSQGPVVTLKDEIGDRPLTFIMILKRCGVGGWNPETSFFLLHFLSLTSSHLLLIPPSYSTLLPNFLLPPPEGSQMTNQFIHEEISMLFCSEKFYGWWWWRQAIIATSSRSSSLRD